MGRNNLAHRTGDAINAVLAAAGYNFHLLLKWLQLLLCRFLAARNYYGRPSMDLKGKRRPDEPSGRGCALLGLSYHHARRRRPARYRWIRVVHKPRRPYWSFDSCQERNSSTVSE